MAKKLTEKNGTQMMASQDYQALFADARTMNVSRNCGRSESTIGES